ncbi:MAG TPA: cyclase family protein [Myxococcota bacterium]
MPEILNAEMVREWGERYSNEGRWPAADALGTLNFISPERVRTACTLPRRGLVVSCAVPFDRRTPSEDGAWGERKTSRAGSSGADAREDFSAHSAPETQWSPRARVFCGGSPAAARRGADRRRSSAPWRDPAQDGVVGRGVLLDFPRFVRRPWLDGGTRILPHDLDNCAEALGVAVERGDIVLVRTGRITRCFHEGSWQGYPEGPAPGLSAHCARWLYEREVAAVASDTWSVEVNPNESDAHGEPLHEIALDRTGLLFGENFHLDTLSEACAADGEYAFLFTAPLLSALGAAGYPINPLAIK